MSRRILFVTPSLRRGGAQSQLALLARGLAARDFDIHIAYFGREAEWEPALAAAGVSVHRINQRWTNDPRNLWRLNRHIKTLAPDIVHLWQIDQNLYGLLAATSAGAKRVFTTEQSTDRRQGVLSIAQDRYFARKCERFIVNCAAVKQFYVERAIPAEKLSIIPCGVESFVPPTPNPRAALLEDLGLPANDNIQLVAAIGRLSPTKRIKDCIWAAELLKVVRDDVHLLIIGDGPDRWRAERYCRLVGNHDKVHFLGERGDIPRILPHLLGLWSVGARDGHLQAILEAMAAGLPVVASDIPSHRDLVIPNETGHLVPLGDPAALARKTQTLLKDLPFARQLGLAGQAKVLGDYSAERMVFSHLALYGPSLD